jgi:polysaccharide export outer membrane protein
VTRTCFSKFVLEVPVIAGLAFLVVAAAARAQSAANERSLPSSELRKPEEVRRGLRDGGVTSPERADLPQVGDSRIGPDDLLDITVFEAPEMNRTMRVSTSGDISFELLGVVHASGLTASELESVLQERLRGTYMKDPHVGVFVHEWQSHSVSVVGAVKMPGVFQIRGTKTLIEVLSMAQGVADDAGDTVLITHGTREARPDNLHDADPKQTASEQINLRKLLNSAEPALNVPIYPGDIVRVSRAGIVYVVGEVNKPGGFVLQNNENISVLQALALAEGLTHTSSTAHARIIRTDAATGKRTEIPMDLRKILAGKSPDALLQPKDVVFVPNSAAKSVLYRGSEAALQTAAGVAIYKW